MPSFYMIHGHFYSFIRIFQTNFIFFTFFIIWVVLKLLIFSPEELKITLVIKVIKNEVDCFVFRFKKY